MIQNLVAVDWESIANRIAARYGPVGLPADGRSQQTAKIQKRIGLVLNRLQHSVSDRNRAAYRQKFDCLLSELEEIAGQLANADRHLIPVSEILLDIRALQEEFSDVSFDSCSGELSVLTFPIELEGVYLGPFRIELGIKTLSPNTKGSYYITAVDPYAAASDSDVIHPHVNHGSLCEGEAMQPIRTALLQGRLFDFFQIVNQVLNTYNEASAYVPLSDWGDIRCHDCGHLTCSDESYGCYDCEESVCESCYCECCHCDERFCNSCSGVCTGCLSSICKSCVKTIDQKPGDYCPSCVEKLNEINEEKDEEETEEATTQDNHSHVTVHADILGQTAVPA